MPRFTYHPLVNLPKDAQSFSCNAFLKEFQSFIWENIATYAENIKGKMPDSVKNTLLLNEMYVCDNGLFTMVYVKIGEQYSQDNDYLFERFDMHH